MNRRVETKNKLDVEVVELGKKEDSVDRAEGDPVVGGFTDKSDRVSVNFDRKSASASTLVIVSKRYQMEELTWASRSSSLQTLQCYPRRQLQYPPSP